MDHIRISGTGPSLVILSKTKKFKKKNEKWSSKMPKNLQKSNNFNQL